MALTILKDEKAIKSAINKILVALKESGREKKDSKVKIQGRQRKVLVRMSTKYDLFFVPLTSKDKKKYFLCFGSLGLSGKNLVATCRIPVPAAGINGRLGGAFAQDENGKVFLVYRSKRGGGGHGLGSEAFWGKYAGIKRDVVDGDRKIGTFYILGELGSQKVLRQIAEFVREVESSIPGAGPIEVDGPDPFPEDLAFHDRVFNRVFRPEFMGMRNRPGIPQKDVDVLHGVIVEGLHDILEERGYELSNDKNRDLYIFKRNKITTLFEIKPNALTSSIYSAIGQLLFHSVGLSKRPRLVFVTPEEIGPEEEERIVKMGIDVLKFRLRDGVADFPDLSKWKF